MFKNLFNKKKQTIVAEEKEYFTKVVDGETKELSIVDDPLFSSKALGDGYAMVAGENKKEIFSPINGEILSVFPTKHAIAMKSTNGLEVLIHIGIDTVELQGKGFDMIVNEGEIIKQGQLLGRVDFDYILKNNKSPDVMVIITNLESREFTLTTNPENEYVGFVKLVG
ncbi:phosphotransferase system sugar-specific permease eiia type 1 [Trichococcus palustris]|uniref:Phosphotransferase system sugar-specific permease eiia type 1 n=1 Tax=Trichococcus palustris TaxID=140314 RepID=A0A143YXR9_9LACT|nr:PTS glucose transporter subunit IIA [Trichococcus palustris]CZQ98424.1 phosphotransferase system sugar-specific permease eiia type 1 [Trichococcus palustris]SFK94827.1 PTS system, glucose-specific IIA component [Trichococcus palustris]